MPDDEKMVCETEGMGVLIDNENVTLPREDYDRLVAGNTMLAVVRRLVDSETRSYLDLEIFKRILDIARPMNIETDE